jgi:hypothetical protein
MRKLPHLEAIENSFVMLRHSPLAELHRLTDWADAKRQLLGVIVTGAGKSKYRQKTLGAGYPFCTLF